MSYKGLPTPEETASLLRELEWRVLTGQGMLQPRYAPYSVQLWVDMRRFAFTL